MAQLSQELKQINVVVVNTRRKKRDRYITVIWHKEMVSCVGFMSQSEVVCTVVTSVQYDNPRSRSTIHRNTGSSMTVFTTLKYFDVIIYDVIIFMRSCFDSGPI